MPLTKDHRTKRDDFANECFGRVSTAIDNRRDGGDRQATNQRIVLNLGFFRLSHKSRVVTKGQTDQCGLQNPSIEPRRA